jgi:hypothetical protein
MHHLWSGAKSTNYWEKIRILPFSKTVLVALYGPFPHAEGTPGQFQGNAALFWAFFTNYYEFGFVKTGPKGDPGRGPLGLQGRPCIIRINVSKMAVEHEGDCTMTNFS